MKKAKPTQTHGQHPNNCLLQGRLAHETYALGSFRDLLEGVVARVRLRES